MANQEHLDILKQGVEFWNQWRKQDLSHMLMLVANSTHLLKRPLS